MCLNVCKTTIVPRTAKITDICFAFVCENILKVEFWHVVKWMKVIPVCVQAKNGEMRSTLQFFLLCAFLFASGKTYSSAYIIPWFWKYFQVKVYPAELELISVLQSLVNVCPLYFSSI